MPSTGRRYTAAEVLAFPDDGNRYEVVDGELLVTPAPAPLHQIILGRIYVDLHDYLESRPGVAKVLFSPADIQWSDERLVQPDIFVVPEAEVTNRWTSYRTLLLAVEVVSPGSGRADRVIKRRLYQQQGVQTYWVVDAEAALVEVWHPASARPEIVTDVLTWQVMPESPGLEIRLERLFENLPR